MKEQFQFHGNVARLIYLVAGAFAYWLPHILLEILSHRRESLALETLVPFVGVVIVYAILSRFGHGNVSKAVWMLVGIYVLGPVSTAIAATPFQGGFSQYDGWTWIGYLVLFSLVPPLQIVDAAYVGAVFGMLLATFFLIVAALWKERVVSKTRAGA